MHEQIIWTGNTYEKANETDCAERPEWPVQDAGAHWHHEQFAGQCVCFKGAQVYFGQMCAPVEYVDGMDQDNLIVLDDGTVWRAD